MPKQQEYIPVAIYDNNACGRAEPLLAAEHDEEEGNAAAAAVQGRKYCCCFDMRRAVILINLIDFAIVFFGVMAIAANILLIEEDKEKSNNEKEELVVELKSSLIWLACALARKIPLNGLGVYGASAFKIWPVLLCLCGHVYGHIYILYFSFFGGAATFALFHIGAKDALFLGILSSVFNLPIIMFIAFIAYPHLRFMYEVKTGVMSEKTYPRERSGLLTLCC